MKVLVTDNVHFLRSRDGKYYTPSIYDNDFFKRYIDVFGQVRFVAKTQYVDYIDESKYIRIDIEGLEIFELPWYRGLKGMIKKMPQLIYRYSLVSKGCDCAIFRVAQIESYLSYLLGWRKKPFAVEVVNDPETFLDVKGFFRKVNTSLLKKMTRSANGASYVTESTLQQKYPSKSRLYGESDTFFESFYSSIELLDTSIGTPKTFSENRSMVKLVHTANSINSDVKGHKVVIDVVNILIKRGMDVIVTFIGDGEYVDYLKKYAANLDLSDKVHFIGRLHQKSELLSTMQKCDLFIFPTQMEGLPRAIIEAMAVGLPCLSTPIAGIPELIESKYLFDPHDSKGFADMIEFLNSNNHEMEQMSIKNIETAKKYSKSILDSKRRSFYMKIRKLCQQ